MDDAQFSDVGTEMAPELIDLPNSKTIATTFKVIRPMPNQTVQERIIKEILKVYVRRNEDLGQVSSVTYGSLEINQFSICFRLSAMFGDARRSFYVKIPKWDMYRKTERTIMPLTESDKSFAADEYRSLKKMAAE